MIKHCGVGTFFIFERFKIHSKKAKEKVCRLNKTSSNGRLIVTSKQLQLSQHYFHQVAQWILEAIDRVSK